MRRAFALLATVLCLLLLFSLSVCAEEDGVGDAYSSFTEAIPKDVADLLPEGIFSEDMGEVNSAVREVTGFGWFMGKIGEILGADMGGALRLFARLLGILVLAALLSTVRGSIGSEALAKTVELCGSCAIVGSLLSLTSDAVTVVADFLYFLSEVRPSSYMVYRIRR